MTAQTQVPQIIGSKQEVLKQIDAQLLRGRELKRPRGRSSPTALADWRLETEFLLRRDFTTDEFSESFKAARAASDNEEGQFASQLEALRQVRVQAAHCVEQISDPTVGAVYGGRWQVVRKLGSGGQGSAFLVVGVGEDNLGKKAALKLSERDGGLDRFKTEVAALEKLQPLNHPGIITLLESHVEEPPAYFVMEYCEGGCIALQPKRWAEDPLGAVEACIEICDAVAAAHNVGLVHRDLKPQNVLLRTSTGPIVVGDFGLVRMGDAPNHTRTQEVVGPRKYMAPESRDGRVERVGPESDVYSIGKILYWMASGGDEFDREDHRLEDWDLARRFPGQVIYEMINTALDRMLVREPSKRAPSASDVRLTLEEIRRRTKLGARLLNPHSVQMCAFCRDGTYDVHHAVPHGASAQVAAPAGPTGQLRPVLVCTKCGHLASFRTDVNATPWWGPEAKSVVRLP